MCYNKHSQAGGLDNYLLKTHPRKLDSKIALEYRAILEEELAKREAAKET